MVAVAVLVPSAGRAADCSQPIAFLPIPDLRVHRGFPVDFRAAINRHCLRTINFAKLAGPPEFDLDGAGGLFYWTPARTGTETITIRVTEEGGPAPSLATATFHALVDDVSLASPLFRDYLAQPTNVPIVGRAYGTGFSSYTLEYAERDTPTVRHLIAGPIGTPVSTTGLLANWDISALPDGGRYLLTLTVQLDGQPSVLTDPVIVDRTAKPGWPKRVGPITHSVVAADLDDDGREELLAVTHFGELYAWRIDGTELFEVSAVEGGGQATYTGPAVGDIDGDGAPEIVWATIYALYAHRADGTLLPGFPVPAPYGREFRATPTLADLDGDGRLDILAGATAFGGRPRLTAYGYADGTVRRLRRWPRQLGRGSALIASASVADLDGDGLPEIVAESYNRLYAWRASGRRFFRPRLLAAPIGGTDAIDTAGISSLSQPAIADLDGDGSPEIIVGSNVLRRDGTPAPGWEGAKPGAIDTLSAAVGDLDGMPANGLEVVLGRQAWHADGTPVAGYPFSTGFGSAVLGDCGEGHLDTVVGVRTPATPGVDAFHPDGARIEDYPKSLYGNPGDLGAPVIGDFDADGLVDVAVAITDASYGGIVAVWNMPGANHDEHHHWPMLGHDARHTGAWTPPPPNRPTNLVATPVTGGTSLAWLDHSAVEDAYVVERSPTGAPWTYTTVAQLPANTTSAFVPTTGGTYRIRARRDDPRTAAPILSPPSNAVGG